MTETTTIPDGSTAPQTQEVLGAQLAEIQTAEAPPPSLPTKLASRPSGRLYSCKKCPFTTLSFHDLGVHYRFSHPKQPGSRPEEETMAGEEDIKKVLVEISERLQAVETKLGGSGIPLARVQEAVQAAVKEAQASAIPADTGKALEAVQEQVDDLAGKVAATAPQVEELAAKREVLSQVCERWPELCVVLDERKQTQDSATKDPHGFILEALSQAGLAALGRVPTWADLLDLCPDGDCGSAAIRALLKRPALLEKALMGDESMATTLIELLKKSGKLAVEPAPPAPGGEEVTHGAERPGWFGRIPKPGE